MIHHAVSVAGFIIFAGIAWLLSSNRRKIAWRTIAWGAALQLLIGLIIFRLPGSHRILLLLNDAVLALLNASKSGSVFLFGPLAASPGESGSIGFILVFQVLPVVIFFAAFTSMLYHLRVLQVFVRLFARIFHRTMKISGAESLSSAANIFVGIESALVVRPYLEKMTRSELLLVLTTGMATVASSTLGVYVAFLTGVFPQIAGHLISASVLAIPACVVVSKLLIPETETPETLAAVPRADESARSKNLISSIIEGAMDGLKLAAGVSALLIAILGIVALVDKLLGVGSSWLGMSEPLSCVRILSWGFLSLRLPAGTAIERYPGSGSLVGRASYPDGGLLLQPSRTVNLQRTNQRSADRGDPELRALRIRTRRSDGNLCRRHCRTCSLASRRPREPWLTGLAGSYPGNVDDWLCRGNIQQRRRRVAVSTRLNNGL